MKLYSLEDIKEVLQSYEREAVDYLETMDEYDSVRSEQSGVVDTLTMLDCLIQTRLDILPSVVARKVHVDTLHATFTEIATQDNRATAAPYYYQIQDEEEIEVAPSDADHHTYSLADEDIYGAPSIDEVKKTWLENRGVASEEELDANEKATYNEIAHAVTKRGIRKVKQHSRLFFTEREAKEHLAANKHHYSHGAITYVSHAWRAPEVAAVWKAMFGLLKIDKGNCSL